jgi:hypothetical protein
MTAKPSKIEHLRIATPCPISWEQMSGDNRVRFCDHCNLNVYNISELTRVEAGALIASNEGRLCAKLFRRADGTVLTKDCPVGLRALRRRVAKRSAAIFAAIVSLSAVALGQQSSGKKEKASCTPQTRITRTDAKPDHSTKPLAGTVTDPNGALILRFEVRLTNLDTKETRQTTSNDDGRFEFDSLAVGNYSITLRALNYKECQPQKLVIKKDKTINLDMIMEPNVTTETVGLLLDNSSLIDTPPGTMIINEKMIQRLPHQK